MTTMKPNRRNLMAAQMARSTLTCRAIMLAFCSWAFLAPLTGTAHAQSDGQSDGQSDTQSEEQAARQWQAPAGSPVARHGALSVSPEGKIVGENGEVVSLAGPSFFWSTTGWGQERFYNAEAVNFFADEWNAGIVRAAMGVEVEGGYLSDREGNLERVFTIVDAAIDKGIYVLIDWHTHHAEDNVGEAMAFFQAMARRYGDTPNVIYEIYNEPLDTTEWSRLIKRYAQDYLIPAIREVDPDNIILVGTRTWSQDVDLAVADPVVGFENIAYTFHFYAGTHGDDLRDKLTGALDAGLPIIVSEWGSVNADGNGKVAKASTRKWLKILEDRQLIHLIWSVSDKKEGSAMFKRGAPSNGGWTDDHLTPSGKLARDTISRWNADDQRSSD